MTTDVSSESSEEEHTKNGIWCKEQEKLISKWAERAAGYRWLHNHARMMYKKKSDRLTYPTIIISSITGVGGFAVLSPDNVSEEKRVAITLLQFVFAAMNIISGILTSIAKFSQTQKLSEEHSMMAVQYAKFYRGIDMELSLHKEDRVPVIKYIQRCREEYDKLLSESPDIPEESVKAFNEAFPTRVNKPDVCNGLSIIDPTQKSTRSLSEKIIPRL